jgi:hypothetical protein
LAESCDYSASLLEYGVPFVSQIHATTIENSNSLLESQILYETAGHPWWSGGVFLKARWTSRIGIIGIVVIFILSSQLWSPVAAASKATYGFYPQQTTTTTFEVVPDPSLATGVEIHVQGDSGEFNASHVMTGGVSSYVNLTWSHTAGTELTLTQIPSHWEFCYFTVAFPWDLNKMPTDAMFYVTYAIHATGDFNSTEGETMFSVHAWLIDSSGNWRDIYESEPPYPSAPTRYYYDLNYFDLVAGWSGMVANQEGVQEDPEDVLCIGVGLAPTEAFETYNAGYPWQQYNGSVTALVHTISLEVMLETEETSMPIEPTIAVGIGIALMIVVAYATWRRYRSTEK